MALIYPLTYEFLDVSQSNLHEIFSLFELLAL